MDGNEFCVHDSVLSANTNIGGDKSFNFSLTDMDCTSNDLCLFESPDNKAASDFLYYDWPDLGNFEDVDRMFRSCESTFGLGVSKEDELGWLSSADDLGLGGSGDLLKSVVKFPCPEPNVAENVSENHASMEGCSIIDSSISTTPIRSMDSSWISGEPFVIGPATVNCEDGFITHEQIKEHKRHIKLQNQSKGEGKGFCSQNGLPNEVMQPRGLSYHQAFPYVNVPCLSECPKPYGNLQNPVPTLHSDNSHLSHLTSVNLKSSTAKSDNSDLPSLFTRDSFSTCSQLQYTESSCDNLEVSALATSGQREKLQSYQGSQSSVNSSLMEGSVAVFDPGSVRKHGRYSVPEGGWLANPAELGSLNVQEDLTTSSGRDDLSSPEGASFRQLQLVMEQLDLQTKLCIRDGLYRLARNANKRHNHANLSNRCGDGRESMGGASVPNKTTSFSDMETGTNPIDRSIAHLLFHQLSDSSPTTPAHNSFPTMVYE